MDSLRCRAYTRRHLREREIEVEEMEKKVAEAKKQLVAITNENKRQVLHIVKAKQQIYVNAHVQNGISLMHTLTITCTESSLHMYSLFILNLQD